MLIFNYMINSKGNIAEINSLIDEIKQLLDNERQVIDRAKDQFPKDSSLLEILKIYLLFDQIESAKQLIEEIDNHHHKLLAHLEIFKKYKNENDKEKARELIDQETDPTSKSFFLLDFLKVCLEVNPNYDITREKNTLLSHINQIYDIYDLIKIQALLKFTTIYQDDLEIKQRLHSSRFKGATSNKCFNIS